nr:PREDICTED: endogenous retrovirus group K member 11 Pol protein-like [Apteryx mantelli mantelli]
MAHSLGNHIISINPCGCQRHAEASTKCPLTNYHRAQGPVGPSGALHSPHPLYAMGTGCAGSIWHYYSNCHRHRVNFLTGAIDLPFRQDGSKILKLKWKMDTPVWVDQWPLKKERLDQLQQLVKEQLQLGHIVLTTSPWNTPVFCIPKKSGKWRMLHDLRAVNVVIEPMGALQPGLPSPTMLPANWPLTVINVKDCFISIPLHPEDAPRFAFSLPSINHATPMLRYHWVVLPQEMKNSPTICQAAVAGALQPARRKFPDAIIYHYMDDILIAAGQQQILHEVTNAVMHHLHLAGLQIAPEKVQRKPPWLYLGWRITQHAIRPQLVQLQLSDVVTLNDLQKILGAINWLRPVLGLPKELLHPLFEMLKGDTSLTSNRTLTPEAKKALQLCARALEERQGWRHDFSLPFSLALIANRFQPFAVLFQWDTKNKDLLHILEWIFLSHTPPKTLWTLTEMYAKLIIKGRERLQTMNACDPEVIYIPATIENLNWLLSEDWGFQIALADFTGQLSIHYPQHKLWAEASSLPLVTQRRCRPVPVPGLTVFTDASGRSKKAAITWQDPVTQQWKTAVHAQERGSVQVLEMVAVHMAFELCANEPVNVVTDSCYATGVVQRLEASFLCEVSSPLLFAELYTLWTLINHRKHDFYVLHVHSHTDLVGPIAEGN